jgi:hypothetical protein
MATSDRPHFLGWMSPLFPVWLWHALFDGTPLCRCPHSAEYRGALRRLGTEKP